MTNEFIKHYGMKNQLLKLHEECGELQEAIIEHLADPTSFKKLQHLKEEIGDVDNLNDQFKEEFGDGFIEMSKYSKMERQRGRIKKELDKKKGLKDERI